jgi:hypothetical protein
MYKKNICLIRKWEEGERRANYENRKKARKTVERKRKREEMVV